MLTFTLPRCTESEFSIQVNKNQTNIDLTEVINKLKKHLYKCKYNFSLTHGPRQSSGHKSLQLKPLNLSVPSQKIIRGSASYKYSLFTFIISSHVGEALGHKDNSLSFLRPLRQPIVMLCKTLAFLRIYVAKRNSSCWPEKN